MRFPLNEQKVIGYDYGVPTSYSPKHLGVDWKADFVPLYAPKNGKIINKLVGIEGGNTLWFRPEGESTIIRWLHLNKFYVNKNDHVIEGQMIAETGDSGTDGSGHHPLSHLHEDCWPKGVVTLKFEDTINPHIYYSQTKMQPIFKQQGNATLYFSVGNILVPFSSDFPTYQIDFSNNPIIELSVEQFNKFQIAKGVQVTKK